VETKPCVCSATEGRSVYKKSTGLWPANKPAVVHIKVLVLVKSSSCQWRQEWKKNMKAKTLNSLLKPKMSAFRNNQKSYLALYQNISAPEIQKTRNNTLHKEDTF
jgi:thioredoxin-related protein